MNNRELDKKRKKAQARRAEAKVKRTKLLKATRFEKVDDGWKIPDRFMTGKTHD
jgi:hypothetical protein